MDKLLCKKTFKFTLEKGKWYTFEIIDDKIKIYYAKNLWWQFDDINKNWEYFYTKKEIRKLKLDAIESR